MLKSDIKRAVALVEREGTHGDADRLEIVVKASAHAAKLYEDDLKAFFALEFAHSYKKLVAQLARGEIVVAFLVDAANIANDAARFEADLWAAHVDEKGNVVGDLPGNLEVSIGTNDITLRGAVCIDDNIEGHQDIMACAQAIVYGSGRGQPYYAERTGRRYNPSSRGGSMRFRKPF